MTADATVRTAPNFCQNVSDSGRSVTIGRPLQAALAASLIAIKGYAATELEFAFTWAPALSEELGDKTRIFPILYVQWVFHYVTDKESAGSNPTLSA